MHRLPRTPRSLPRWAWLALTALVALAILVPVSPLYRPVPSDDPSVYLYVGQTVLNGGVPYRDAWDHKQPLAYLLYAAGLALTPHALWGMWLIELTALAGVGLLGFILLERVASRPISFLAVSAALLTLFQILWGYALEELALPLQLFVLLAFIQIQAARQVRPAARWGSLAGLCVGISCFFKQSLIAAGVAVGLYLALEVVLRWRCRDVVLRNLSALSGLAAGFGLVAALMLGYLARAHALADYSAAAFSFNLAYGNLGPLERVRALREGVQFLATVPGLLAAFILWLIVLPLAFVQSAETLAGWLRGRWLAPLAFAGGALLILASLAAEFLGRGEPGFGMTQWMAVLGGAALLLLGMLAIIPALRNPLAAGLEYLGRLSPAAASAAPAALSAEPAASAADTPAVGAGLAQPRREERARLIYLAVLFFPVLLVLATLSGRDYVYYFIPLVLFLLLGLGLMGGLLAEYGPFRRYPHAASGLILAVTLLVAAQPLWILIGAYRSPINPPLPPVIAYVQENTTPQDTIYVWGKYITYTYFLTDRQAPARYFYQAPVALESYNAQHAVSAEILHDLQARPPKLFLIYTEDPRPLPPGAPCPLSAANEPNSPGQVFQFICQRYQYQTTLNDIQVFKRTD